MKRSISVKCWFFLLAATLAICVTGAQADLTCRLSGIAGFDQAGQKAKGYVGSETTSVPSTKVYISVEHGDLYLHSNYVTGGFDYPTKITTSQADIDVRNLAYNLVGEEAYSGVSPRAFINDFPKMTFYVEESLFANAKFGKLDFRKAGDVRIIGGDDVPRPARQLTVGKKIDWIVQCRTGSSVYARLGASIKELSDQFDSLPFRREDIQLLSLVKDSRTNQKIVEYFKPSNRMDFDLSSVDSLRDKFSAQRDRTVVVLGHVENDAFVTLDATNREVFRISFPDLEKIAKENNVNVFPLGCKSARAHSVGAVEAFNTLDAVEHLNSAIVSNPTTYGQFIDRFSAPKQSSSKLALVIDESVLEPGRIRVRTTLYKDREPGRLILTALSVGTLTMALSSSVPIPRGSDSGQNSNPGTDGQSRSIIYGLVAAIGIIGGIVFFLRRRR